MVLITSSDGSKERVDVCADDNYLENDVVCLTTTGIIHILSLPQLRPQLKVEGIKCDNR